MVARKPCTTDQWRIPPNTFLSGKTSDGDLGGQLKEENFKPRPRDLEEPSVKKTYKIDSSRFVPRKVVLRLRISWRRNLGMEQKKLLKKDEMTSRKVARENYIFRSQISWGRSGVRSGKVQKKSDRHREAVPRKITMRSGTPLKKLGRAVLGSRVHQAGSKVDHERGREAGHGGLAYRH